MTGITRSSEGLDPRRRRILFRSWHRGIREMDLIMGRFAETTIADMTDAELDTFEQLMDLPDPDVLAWITGEQETPPEYRSALLDRLRAFHLKLGDHR
ncbi:MAG TPA: succinate dehydrogenase assembly factor 2 [Pseudolabrys sp.]|nr:succinate dehydrogenase assembly factor 2 [Pseudolabrys sp.]